MECFISFQVCYFPYKNSLQTASMISDIHKKFASGAETSPNDGLKESMSIMTVQAPIQVQCYL